MKIIKLIHEVNHFSTKYYNSRAITPARINTIYARSICGVQSVIKRFHNVSSYLRDRYPRDR